MFQYAMHYISLSGTVLLLDYYFALFFTPMVKYFTPQPALPNKIFKKQTKNNVLTLKSFV